MNEQKNSVKQLVERALQKDQEAFSRLYYKTYDRNYYLVLKLVKSEQDTEDILQDTYIKILEKLPQYQYKGENSFASWTGVIASNTALDFLRKKRPALFSEISGDEHFAFDKADESIEFQPEQQYDKKETAEIVSMLLSELSEEQRICILLFYLQDLSVKEIAEQCQCSENTIKSRLNYGRKKIRGQADVLEKYGIHVGETAMVAVLVYFLQKDIVHANGITVVQSANEAAKVMTLVSQSGGMETAAAAGTVTGIGFAGKAVAKIGVKKLVATGITSVLTLCGAGGYAVHKFNAFSEPVNVIGTASPLPATPVSTYFWTETPNVTKAPNVAKTPGVTETAESAETPVSTITPKPAKTVTKEPVTKKPVGTEKPIAKSTKKPVKKPTEKPTAKPTVESTAKPAVESTAKPAIVSTAKPVENPVE